jgi:hypothetical protein
MASFFCLLLEHAAICSGRRTGNGVRRGCEEYRRHLDLLNAVPRALEGGSHGRLVHLGGGKAVGVLLTVFVGVCEGRDSPLLQTLELKVLWPVNEADGTWCEAGFRSLGELGAQPGLSRLCGTMEKPKAETSTTQLFLFSYASAVRKSLRPFKT